MRYLYTLETRGMSLIYTTAHMKQKGSVLRCHCNFHLSIMLEQNLLFDQSSQSKC